MWLRVRARVWCVCVGVVCVLCVYVVCVRACMVCVCVCRKSELPPISALIVCAAVLCLQILSVNCAGVSCSVHLHKASLAKNLVAISPYATLAVHSVCLCPCPTTSPA